jgi:hypothetical protein
LVFCLFHLLWPDVPPTELLPAMHRRHDPATSARGGRLTLGIAGLAAMVTYLNTKTLFVAFPDITNSFGDSPTPTLC